MLTLLLFLTLRAGAAAPGARILDPRILESAVGADDPLAVLKHVWQRGARGSLFAIDRSFDLDCGTYLAVENWSVLKPVAVDGITFLNDEDLLGRIQHEAARGLKVIVHNRTPVGGFAVNTDNTFYELAAAIVPTLSHGPYVAVNGYTNLYLFEHEMAHHADHTSGLSDRLWAEIQRGLTPLKTAADVLEPVYFFIAEARAHEVEFRALEDSVRPSEIVGTADDAERTHLSRVDGPRMRRRRIDYLVVAFNDQYHARLLAYSAELRAAARGFFRAYITDFDARFDADDRLRPRPPQGR